MAILSWKGMEDYLTIYSTTDVDTYLSLRVATELSRKTREAASIGFSISLFGVQIALTSNPKIIIGIGRIIGDCGS